MEGLGSRGTDEPDTFLAPGLKEPGNPLEVGEPDPGIHLGSGRAAGGKNGGGFFSGYPPSLDTGETFLAGIGMDAELQSALGQGGPIPSDRRLQPAPGGGVVVLGQNLEGPGETGFSRSEVGAEEKQIAGFHPLADAPQERKRIEIGENTKQGDESRVAGGGYGGKREVKGGKGLQKVNFA